MSSSSPAQYELSPSPEDVISSVSFAPSSSKLLVSSWDRHLYLYETRADSEAQLIRKYEFRAPVLAVCFGQDDSIAYTTGLDHQVRRLFLESGEQEILSSHTAGAKCLVYNPSHNLLISAAWDKTLNVHLVGDGPVQTTTLNLPNKPFAVTTTSSKLIVAMSARLFHIYELSTLAEVVADGENTHEVEPFQRRESSLKFMTRALAPMPSGEGYASSSIEGRVAVEWIDAAEEVQTKKYAFKCHRVKATDGEAKDVVYPVHALAFHPTNGTFVTGGGDGIVALWDVLAKRRIRQYKAFPASIAALTFSADGKMLAIATSPGFEEGSDDVESGTVKVFVRQVKDDEGKEDKKKVKKPKESAE